jgi:hypothetical protein
MNMQDESGMTGIDFKAARRGCLIGVIYLSVLITLLILLV